MTDRLLDPLPALLEAGDAVLPLFARRDLRGEASPRQSTVVAARPVAKLLRSQLPDGSWTHPGPYPAKYPDTDYRLLATWKRLRYLVQTYELTRAYPPIEAAAEYVLSRQTAEGDIRGLLANQYMPYYHGALLSLLVAAGYADDPRIGEGIRWLLDVRQDDGGWVVPVQTAGLSRATMNRVTSSYAAPIEADRARPFAHSATGMAIRALAAQPTHRSTPAARRAAELLASRFFARDVYASYKAADYWLRFEYPYWWNQLLAALDVVTLVGLDLDHPQVARAVDWFMDNQQSDGTWRCSYQKQRRGRPESPREREQALWITLQICRVLGRLGIRS